MTQDETFTGGLCPVAMEPVSSYILLEQPAEAQDQDPLEQADEHDLAPLHRWVPRGVCYATETPQQGSSRRVSSE